MPERVLDWRNPHPDPRSATFMVAPPTLVDRTKAKAWAGPYVRLDQGQEGACVGFGTTTEAMSTPVRVRPPGYVSTRVGGAAAANTFAQAVYRSAQKLDPWAGEDYDGTDVNSGMKVMRAVGYCTGWRWCSGVPDLVDTLISDGPVVIGVPWLSHMFTPGPFGVMDVSGTVEGGHCICLTGWYPSWHGQGSVLRARNSWGPDWGVDGDCFFPLAGMTQLLVGTPETGPGEAAVPIGRAMGSTRWPP